MSGEIEIAGDVATGMLIGRAVEPHAGEAGHGDHAQGLCLNCGTALQGEFCHACGQAGHVHRTLASIGHDLLHGVFHFEGKIWRTLPMLVAHPGALTRRYIAGERARFVSPLALFLFAVFLTFASIHFDGEVELPQMKPAARQSAIAELDTKIADATKRLAAQQAAPAASGAAKVPEDVAALRSTLKAMQVARSTLQSPQDSDAPHMTFTHVKTNWHALDKGIAKANANPGLALYKLQSSAYKYSWALIPISTPFVALLFLWRRRYGLYDHATFVTYSLAFMLFLVVVLRLCLMIGAPEWMFGSLLAFAPPVHMFAQLRGAYGLRKRSALWRTIALLMFAWIALIVFAAMLLAMGMME